MLIRSITVLPLLVACSSQPLETDSEGLDVATSESALSVRAAATKEVAAAARAMNGSTADWHRAMASMRARPGVFEQLVELSTAAEGQAFLPEEEQVASTRGRWKALLLLGELGDRRANPHLKACAERPLPEAGTVPDDVFGGEYKVRLRAIHALQLLGATEELKQLHSKTPLLRGPIAVSLFELGVKLDGVRRVDPSTLLAATDPTDYNPKGKPEKAKVTPLGQNEGPAIQAEANDGSTPSLAQ